MAAFKGSQTEKNLLTAFAGESQARNRYTFFAKVARKEGYQRIGDIFAETAENEQQHAKEFFKHLEGGLYRIRQAFDFDTPGAPLETAEGPNCNQPHTR